MEIRCHGGKCCGILHIEGFSGLPTYSLPEGKYPGGVHGASGQGSSPGETFFKGEVPKETSLERLDRFLAFIIEKRPSCLVEVTLVNSQKNWGWGKILEERGFKEIQNFRNSNTHNMITVFHRVIEGGK